MKANDFLIVARAAFAAADTTREVAYIAARAATDIDAAFDAADAEFDAAYSRASAAYRAALAKSNDVEAKEALKNEESVK